VTDTKDYLYLEQKEMEIQAVQRGINRYYKNLDRGQVASRGPEMSYIQDGMEKLTPLIQGIRERAARGERMSGVAHWGLPLLSLPADKLAMLTLSTVYNTSRFETRAATTCRLADRVLMQIVYETVKLKEPGVVKWIETHFDDGIKPSARRTLRKRAEKFMQVKWSPRTKQSVGSVLLDLAIKNLSSIEIHKYRSGRHMQATIRVTPDIRGAIEAHHANLSILSPMYYPMVCKPAEWTTLFDGGYLIGDDRPTCVHPVLKAPPWSDLLDSYDAEMLGSHLHAINHMQETKWSTNQFIWNVMEDIYVLDSPIGIALNAYPKEIPTKEGVDWDDSDAASSWKMKAKEVHEHNKNTVGQRSLAMYLHRTAKTAGKYGPYYFAWQMCFRGRFYPQFCGMDPQGDKLNKSYLEFHTKRPLGERGFRNLQIHLANCMGYDKLKLDDRHDAVQGRIDEIRAWVDNPLSNTSWTDKDTTMTLAAANEWVGALNHVGGPQGYETGLPCSIDGKCNGLQHLSALARDPIGATATCLVPSEDPEDIYTLVWAKCDEFILDTITQANFDRIPPVLPEKITPGELKLLPAGKAVRRRRQQDFCAALEWRGKTSRELVKRGAMTWAYGVTKQGIMSQLITDGFLDDMEGSIAVNASFMRDAIYWSVNNVVTSARDVMEWLQTVAGIGFDLGEPIGWTNPAGMYVHQEYLKTSRKSMDTATGRYYYHVTGEERKLLRQKQVNGIAPNFVHAIDSAHMSNVALRLRDEGIYDMHMVHDSYGVHPCHIERLHCIVREEFVKIHRRNLLQEFKDEVEETLGVDLPDYPKQGDFDIEQVTNSKYAFS